jgi:hypothetical protein
MKESTKELIIDVIAKFIIMFVDIAIVYYFYNYIVLDLLNGFPALTYWEVAAIMFIIRIAVKFSR